jgi:hypothetical protein
LPLAVELAGNALPDLWITVLHPGLGSFDTRAGTAWAADVGTA